MDRKPENGCEIQNAACIDSNIMIQLKLVKSKEDEERLESRRSDKEERTELNHGTKVVLDLTKPWNHTGREIIGDSAFASVATAVSLCRSWTIMCSSGVVNGRHLPISMNIARIQ
jgi:hypothetical protein